MVAVPAATPVTVPLETVALVLSLEVHVTFLLVFKCKPMTMEVFNALVMMLSVKFDKYVDKTVPLKYKIIGDYNIPDEYIQEETKADRN